MARTENTTDVLVVGGGPAGLMASLCLRTFHFNVRHIDDRPGPTAAGRADGIQPRTLEILRNIGSCEVIRNSILSAGSPPAPDEPSSLNDPTQRNPPTLVSLGIAKQLIALGVRVYQVAFWDPTPTTALARTSRARSCPDFVDVQDRYTLLIHQGIIEREMMREISSRMIHNCHSPAADPAHLVPGGVERSTKFVGYQVLEDGGEYPVESLIESDGVRQKVRSKYLIGCDGAHSTVRRSIGKDRVALAGRESDDCWGVMDCVVDSDFPDLKLKCLIHSRNAGSIMVIPREQNLVRFYVQLKADQPNSFETQSLPSQQHVQREQATLEICQDRARKIFEPYKLKFKHVDWFSVYRIGQRIANQYTFDGRVILGGDAVHTHSPKAGQGMNISMLDMYSLAWKLNLIEAKIGNRTLLMDSYEEERRGVALELLAFDAQYSSLFSGRQFGNSGDEPYSQAIEIDPEVFIEMFKRNAYFTTGCGATYKPNVLNQTPARKEWRLEVGTRLLPGRFTRLYDGNPVRIEQVVPMDGTFRIHIFLGRSPHSRLLNIGSRLNQRDSFLFRFSSPSILPPVSIFHQHSRIGWARNSFFSFLVIGMPRCSTEDWQFEQVPRPIRELVGDHRLFTDDLPNEIPGNPTPSGPVSLHQKFGVDETRGGLVVVRPDGVVGCLLDGVEDLAWDELEIYFDRFLIPRDDSP